MNSERSGSKEGPRRCDRVVTSSIAAPEILLRSEMIARLRGFESEWMPARMSVVKSHPPLLQHWMS